MDEKICMTKRFLSDNDNLRNKECEIIKEIKENLRAEGTIAAIVPVSRLHDLKREIEDIYEKNYLSKNIKEYLVDHLNFNLSETPQSVRSIIVTATPCSQVRLYINIDNKKLPVIIPPTYSQYNEIPEKQMEIMGKVLEREDYHIQRVYDLPEKLLSVCCGLTEYGRNNITYMPGQGSYVLLSCYYSDISSVENFWRKAKRMDVCSNCSRCVNNCPTGAISMERSLIYAEKCLTYHNELNGLAAFPPWIDPSSHNCIVGCMKCQTCCPQNKKRNEDIIESVEFDEEETRHFIAGTDYGELSQEFRSKFEQLGITWYFKFFQRNLKALLESGSFNL